VSNYGASTEAKRGCGRASHVFSGLITMFVFDILQILIGFTQICRGRIASTWVQAYLKS